MTRNDIHNYDFEDTLNMYLKGELSRDEESQFLNLLAENPELQRKAIYTARLASAMNHVGIDQDQEVIAEIKVSNKQIISHLAKEITEIKNVQEDAVANYASKSRILNLKRIMISFSVAASILLCIFGGYKYYLYNETTQLGREYLAYFPAGDFSRGEDDRLQAQLYGLYQDIDNKTDLDKVIFTLESMWEQSKSETYNDYTEFMPEIGWMLANAYLRDNEKSKALKVLSILADEYPNDTAMGNKVRELKNKIENL